MVVFGQAIGGYGGTLFPSLPLTLFRTVPGCEQHTNDSLQIWALPRLTLVFSTSLIGTLPNVMVDSHDPPGLSPPQDPPRKLQEFDVEQMVVAPLGETTPEPHLFVRFFHMILYVGRY